MTNYYIDTEFLEGTQKKFLLGNTKPTIDLISLALVCEDNREYYAISKDFNLKEAWNRCQQKTGENDSNNNDPKVYWIRDNVLFPIYIELENKYLSSIMKKGGRIGKLKDVWVFNLTNLAWLIDKYGKSNYQIANDVCAFVLGDDCGGSGMSAIEMAMRYNASDKNLLPKFYGYYADYDWVVFCWCFGDMMSLPNDFPKYCNDLKQTLDEKTSSMKLKDFNALRFIPYESSSKLLNEEDIDTFDKRLAIIKHNKNYPKLQNEHNALADAKWNKQLHEFLENKTSIKKWLK